MENNNSKKLYEEACKVLPGGISRNTIYRKPHPNYVEKAYGCYIKDIDGTERIDFANNMASLIHGHSHPEIIKAVIEQLSKGTAYTMASEIEVRFAQLLNERNKNFEKIRFVNSGTEAVMVMIKAARAYTGKPKIAKCEGAYHGTYDFAEISQTSNPDNWGELDSPNSNPVVHGTPKCVLDNVVVFPFNDIERTIKILDKHADSIACVMLDPIPHRVGLLPAKPEYVEAIYNWTRKNKALLVFDEVVTFRVNYGGAQENYNVSPDLTALGKIIGGGFPVGAVAGKAEIMDILDPRQTPLLFPHSGTFSANPITMTAGYTAMKMFDRNAVKQLNALTEKTIHQINEVIEKANVPVSLTGAGSMFRIHLRKKPPVTYREAYQSKETKNLIEKLLDYMYNEEKILMINTFGCMFSTVMTEKETNKLVEGLYRAFVKFKDEIINIQNK